MKTLGNIYTKVNEFVKKVEAFVKAHPTVKWIAIGAIGWILLSRLLGC